jgi:hypothetical protein
MADAICIQMLKEMSTKVETFTWQPQSFEDYLDS